ncbi:uncharacterized protein PS065_015644 [Dugong dugon]
MCPQRHYLSHPSRSSQSSLQSASAGQVRGGAKQGCGERGLQRLRRPSTSPALELCFASPFPVLLRVTSPRSPCSPPRHAPFAGALPAFRPPRGPAPPADPRPPHPLGFPQPAHVGRGSSSWTCGNFCILLNTVRMGAEQSGPVQKALRWKEM